MVKPLGVVFLPSGVGKGTRPRLEGRAESVPEAGGTGVEAVATPTTLSASHDADSAAKPDGLDERWPVVGGRHLADWPPGGRSHLRKQANSPTANAAGVALFREGSKGGGAPLARARMFYIA